MATIDLTLDSFKVPAIESYTPPFGTKIVKTDANKGGLSTVEVNSNVMMPFSNMRPKVVTEDSTTTVVEYDAKIVFSSSLQAGVDLTLLAGDYEGCKIQFSNLSTFSCTISYNNILIGYVLSEETVEIIWTGSTWTIFGNVPVGSIISYPGSVAPIGWHLCNGDTANRTNYPYLITWAIRNNLIGNGKLFGAGDGETTFTFPDLREIVIVGAGKNERYIFDDTETDPATGIAGTQAHDVYTLGEFKDDQLQGHFHKPLSTRDNGSILTDYGVGSSASLSTSGGAANKSLSTGAPITDGTNGTPRTGPTTHGKQVGLYYIIKI